MPAADEKMADALTLIASIYDERNERDRKVHERLIGLLDQVSDKIVAVLKRSVAGDDGIDDHIDAELARTIVVNGDDLVPNPAGPAMASIILDTMNKDPGERHFTNDDRKVIQAWMVNKLAACNDGSLTITRDAWATIVEAVGPRLSGQRQHGD